MRLYNDSRQQWLEERKKGIGGSDASSILGLNPYKTNIELWEEKTNRRKELDISDNINVKYGVDSEPYLRKLFELDFPCYTVKHKNFNIIKHKEYDFLLASLDGELIEKSTKRKGILEIKTTTIKNATQSEKWNNKIPMNYYIQVLHYLLVTGYDFAVVKAQIKTEIEDEVYIKVNHYKIEKRDVTVDIDYLLKKEIEFWQHNVLKDIKPNLLLPEL